MSNKEQRVRRKVRRSYITSTISIALVLFMLGAVSYVTLSAISAADALKDSVVIFDGGLFILFQNDALHINVIQRRNGQNIVEHICQLNTQMFL